MGVLEKPIFKLCVLSLNNGDRFYANNFPFKMHCTTYELHSLSIVTRGKDKTAMLFLFEKMRKYKMLHHVWSGNVINTFFITINTLQKQEISQKPSSV